MKVVLVTKIKNLGNIGDIVDVKSGFARNFLLPYHKALPATDEYIKDFEEKKEEYLKKLSENISLENINQIITRLITKGNNITMYNDLKNLEFNLQYSSFLY